MSAKGVRGPIRRRVETRLLPGAVAVALALAACTGGSPSGSPSATSAPTPTTTSSGPSSPTSVPTTATPKPPSTTRTTAPGTTTSRPRPTTSTTTPKPTTTCSIPSGLRGRDLTTLGTTRRVVALTFDGGADNAAVGSILDTLARKGVPGTFFLTGAFVDAFPTSAKAIARHPIGNHTATHPDLTRLSDSRVRTEIRTAATRIRQVTGQDPRPYFRFPFGAVDARTISIVNSECYVPFRWTVDTLGWKGTSGGQSVSTVVHRVLDAARPGEIVLMHVGAHPTDHSTLDAAALPTVIDELRERGYSFVTLSAVIGPAP